MPQINLFLKRIDVNRMLDYGQTPSGGVNANGNLRVLDVSLLEKGKAHILLDVIFSMKDLKGKSVMDARLEVGAIYESEEKKVVEMCERWKENSQVRTDVYYFVGNTAFRYCVLTLLPVMERMNLPPLIALPAPIPPPKKTK